MYTDFTGKQWYKGNLHAHTTQSDGSVSPEECAARYRNKGYDFLAITDHWVPSQTVEQDGFLLLSGIEFDTDYYEPYYDRNRHVFIHINGLGFTSPPQLEKTPGLNAQRFVDAITAAGGIAIFNHPEWSRNIPKDILSLAGLSGVEIFNTVSGIRNSLYDYYGSYIDQLAIGGFTLPVLAADDSHWYTGEEGRAFVMVQAESLTRDGIMAALKTGRFFASQGPWVQVERTGHIIRINATPVSEIRIYSNRAMGKRFRETAPITYAEYELPEDVYYYRVEVTDESGNRAWTSPVLL
jgi:hypothetical protein